MIAPIQMEPVAEISTTCGVVSTQGRTGVGTADIFRKAFGECACTLQHECDDAIPIEPHCPAIRRQHSCSAAVMVMPGRRQAMAGAAKDASINTATILARCLTKESVLHW